MIRFNRRNTVWLAALSLLMLLVLLSSNIGTEVQAFFVGVFLLAVVGAFINAQALRGGGLLETIQQRSPLNRNRMSPDAREAIARASSRPGFRDGELSLADVGVITSQTGSEGMVMRRTRTISKDDDGVRPFVTLNVPLHEAERHSNIRFEVIDQNGEEQYVYDMRVFLREGEMNILADTHLPLAGNDMIAGMGDWDLRVYIDTMLVAVHNFSLTASHDTRVRRLGGEAQRNQRYVTRSAEEAAPMSLEDLLRGSDQDRRG